jgi:ribosomal protein S18 acetylase RimI-like enzyme
MDEALIRPAAASDTVAIGKLWEQLVEYHRSLDPDMPQATPQGAQIYARNLASRLEDPQTRVFVAERDGRVVGYVLGVVVDLMPEIFQQEVSGFLADIYVEDAYRGQGIGHALVDGLADWFRMHGVRYIEWHVAASNTTARAFWESLGARPWQIRMRLDIQE